MFLSHGLFRFVLTIASLVRKENSSEIRLSWVVSNEVRVKVSSPNAELFIPSPTGHNRWGERPAVTVSSWLPLPAWLLCKNSALNHTNINSGANVHTLCPLKGNLGVLIHRKTARVVNSSNHPYFITFANLHKMGVQLFGNLQRLLFIPFIINITVNWIHSRISVCKQRYEWQ